MTQSVIRWGILGTAHIALHTVIPAIQQSETGEVAAIASRSGQKSKQAADKLGIPKAYGSYEELLADPDIDAIYIPLPNHMHREWTIRAARARKHVLCEKPLALTERHAVQMVEACEMAGVKLAEAFMYRYHPRYDRIKEILRTGEIGEIRLIQGCFTFNGANDKNNIRFQQDMGGGSLYDVGCYPISAARYLLDREPQAATVHALFSDEHGGVDMMASGLLEFEGGVALTFDCGMWADFRNTLQILGTKGRVDVPSAFLCSAGLGSFTVTVNGETRTETPSEVNQYTVQADEFGRSILFDQRLRFDPWDSVKNMRAIDACLRSARERSRILVEPGMPV